MGAVIHAFLSVFILEQGARHHNYGISTLVLTHCERFLKEERERMICELRRAHQSVAELMSKGILAVGFPDSSYIQSGSQLSQSVIADQKKLRELIYSCNAGVVIPQADTTSVHLDTGDSCPILWQRAVENLQIAQGYQSRNNYCCCSIL